jgi:hypothetical protein
VSEYKTDSEKALQQAREELLGMFKEREDLEIRIAKQQRRVAALAVLVDESEETSKIMGLDDYGLTDAIRTAFKSASPHGLTIDEVRIRLIQFSFPVNEYSNFRASLNSVLKRLVDAKEVRIAIHDIHEGRNESVYQWIQKFSAEPSGMSPANDPKKWHLGDPKRDKASTKQSKRQE